MKLAYSAASPYVRKVNACAIKRGIDKQIERLKIGTLRAHVLTEIGRTHVVLDSLEDAEAFTTQALAEAKTVGDPDETAEAHIVLASSPRDYMCDHEAASRLVLDACFAGQGVDAMSAAPDEFAAFIREELTRWAKVVKESGARID